MTTAMAAHNRMTTMARALIATLIATVMLIGGLTSPPRSRALELGGVTTGPLLRLADVFGLHSITIPNVPVLGDITINLSATGSDPRNLYHAVNAFPFGGFALGNFYRQPGGTLGTAILASSGIAVGNAVEAYEALLASARGATPSGYTPLTPSGKVNSLTGASCSSGLLCVQGTNVTNLALVFVNDPGTPNGGLHTRFGSILKLFGLDPLTPGGQSASSTGIRVNAATVSVGWGYSLISDFPETINPVSLLNSLLATFLPTNLLGGFTLGGASTTDLATNLGLLATLGTTSSSYSMLVPKNLPLLEPLRLPAQIINLVLGALGVKARLGTPLANALQPALSILTNIGYTDVVLPSQGGTYNRSYDDLGTYTQFMSKAVLTPKQWLQIPGDVIRALIVGFQDQFPILRFGRPAPTLVPAGDHLAISYAKPTTVAATATVATASPAAAPTPTAATPARSRSKVLKAIVAAADSAPVASAAEASSRERQPPREDAEELHDARPAPRRAGHEGTRQGGRCGVAAISVALVPYDRRGSTGGRGRHGLSGLSRR